MKWVLLVLSWIGLAALGVLGEDFLWRHSGEAGQPVSSSPVSDLQAAENQYAAHEGIGVNQRIERDYGATRYTITNETNGEVSIRIDEKGKVICSPERTP